MVFEWMSHVTGVHSCTQAGEMEKEQAFVSLSPVSRWNTSSSVEDEIRRLRSATNDAIDSTIERTQSLLPRKTFQWQCGEMTDDEARNWERCEDQGAVEHTFTIDAREVSPKRGTEFERIDDILVVRQINGPLKQWNDNLPKLMIRPGDRIVSVNGVVGTQEELVAEMQKGGAMKIEVSHPPEFLIKVDRGGAHLGMGVASVASEQEPGLLKISGLGEGAIKAWNRRHPHKEVLVGDSIAAVNGIYADPQRMLLELQTRDHLEILITRPYGP